MPKKEESLVLKWNDALNRTVYASLGLQWETLFDRQALLNRIEVIVHNETLRQDFVRRLSPTCDIENIRGVFGELLFWHLLGTRGIELEPSGIQDGAPDFKIVGKSTYLEVTKPFISNLENYRCHMESAGYNLSRKYEVQQQEMTGTIKKKFDTQLRRWHSDAAYIGSSFYLCLDLADFSPSDMAGHVGGFDAVGRLMYGLGNSGIDISRSSREVIGSFVEDKPKITKHNGAPIDAGYLNDETMSQLAGVLTVDVYGNFTLYKNNFTTIHDNTFESDWVNVVQDSTTLPI